MDDDVDLPDGIYYDDDWPTVPCRYCRAEIAEESEQCPRCGQYLSNVDLPGEPKSKFWIVMMILALVVVALFLL